MAIRTRLVVVAAVMMAASACSGGTTPTDAASDAVADNAVGPPTGEEIQSLVMRRCAIGSSCHSSDGLSGNMDLSPTQWYATLVNQPASQLPRMLRVAPGHPELSYLMFKLEGTMSTLPECAADAATCGTAMPMVAGGMLPAASLDRVRQWIAMGAFGPDGSAPPPVPDAGGAMDAASDVSMDAGGGG